jgi:hypothetical protein
MPRNRLWHCPGLLPAAAIARLRYAGGARSLARRGRTGGEWTEHDVGCCGQRAAFHGAIAKHHMRGSKAAAPSAPASLPLQPPDHVLKMRVMDASSVSDPTMVHGVELMVFSRNPADMPQVEAPADIIRLQNVKVGAKTPQAATTILPASWGWGLAGLSHALTPQQQHRGSACKQRVRAPPQRASLTGSLSTIPPAGSFRAIPPSHEHPSTLLPRQTGPILERTAAAARPAHAQPQLQLRPVPRGTGGDQRTLPGGRLGGGELAGQQAEGLARWWFTGGQTTQLAADGESSIPWGCQHIANPGPPCTATSSLCRSARMPP